MQFNMVASSRTLEITVISGENMYLGRNPVTKDTYVVVRTESLSFCTTKMAEEEGSNLSWNEKLFLNIPMHARSVTFEVQCKTSNGIVKSVGVARIALSDLIGGSSADSGDLQVLSYRLRDWEGRRNGVINFSVRMKTTEDCSKEKPAKETVVSSCGFQNEVMGFQVGDKNFNGVVTGIPIWWKYPSNI